MTDFTMSAVLTADKRLEFDALPTQNQGENQTTTLVVALPNGLSSYDYYLEFYCPHGKKYLSPLLTKTTTNGVTQVSYVLPNCLLADEGLVSVQIVARNNDNDSYVFKSSMTSRSSFFVNGSINADDNATVFEDYYSKAKETLDTINDAFENLVDLQEQIKIFTKEFTVQDWTQIVPNNPQLGYCLSVPKVQHQFESPYVQNVIVDSCQSDELTVTESTNVDFSYKLVGNVVKVYVDVDLSQFTAFDGKIIIRGM